MEEEIHDEYGNGINLRNGTETQIRANSRMPRPPKEKQIN
jgi:hypothetical protein